MVRGMRRIVIGFLVVFGMVTAAAGAFLATKKPAQRPPSTDAVTATPELVARGKYLAEAMCIHCHTEPNQERWTFLGNEDKRAMGGLCWDEKLGFPGRVCSKNLTPDRETGLGAWTDGEILRAMREGVSREGTALFPIMPYPSYRTLSDDDARAIVAYLRTLQPRARAVPPRELRLPLSLVVKFMPQPLGAPVAGPPTSDAVGKGRYLAEILGCKGCHTPVDRQKRPILARAFSGGQEFAWPGGGARSSNLTPHETGLGGRTKENFIAMFKAFAGEALATARIAPAQNTVMPWLSLAALTEDDLGAIYDFLKTVPAIANTVEKRPGPAVR
jgi:mono/diheme cytochrome c family protein